MITRYNVLLFGLACQCGVFAQVLRFQQIHVDDGLSDPTVTCLLESRSGYIYIGTERGLDRYDGQRISAVSGTDGWPRGAHVTSLAEDGSGQIWITTAEHGLGRYDPVRDTMHVHRRDGPLPESIPSDRLNHVLVHDDSLLFISSRDVGLVRHNTRTGAWSHRGYRFDHIGPQGDTLWVQGTGWSNSTVRIDGRRIWSALVIKRRSLLIDVFTGRVLGSWPSLHEDNMSIFHAGLTIGDTLYAAAWVPGLHAFPIHDDGEAKLWDIGEEVTALAPWTNGRIALGSKNNGLLLLDPRTGSLERIRHDRTDPTSIANDRIHSLLHDSEGNLWVGTTKGLSVHAPSVQCMHVHDLWDVDDKEQPDLTFHDIVQEPDGKLRISTSHGFVTLASPEAKPHHIPVTDKGRALEITGSHEVHADLHYVSTETGLFRYDRGTESIITTGGERGMTDQFMGHQMYQVRSIHGDMLEGRPVLIVHALGFAPRAVDLASGKDLGVWYRTLTKGIPWGLTRNAVRDTNGTYWTATSTGVLSWSLDDPAGSLRVYGTDGTADLKLPAGDIRSVHLLRGAVWAIPRNTGLLHLTREGIAHHAPPSHLPQDVLGVTMDHRGRIWCSTMRGLLRLDPADGTWLRVPVNDGLRFPRLTAAITTLEDGRIAACADNCLITFDPGAWDALPPLPTPYLIRPELSSQRDGNTELLRMPYRSSSFSATLSALRPVGPAPLELLYRLDGPEEEYRSTTARTPIHYAGVPVGTHQLQVRVRDAYGRTGPAFQLLTVRVVPPFWSRWWFHALLAILIGTGVYLWSRYRLLQALKLHAMRDRIASDLHDEVGSSLSSITIGSKLAAQLSTSEDDRVHHLLERIGETSNASLRSIGDIVWAIDPKNDEGDALILRMRRIAHELLERKGVGTVWNIHGDVESQKLPMVVRKEVLLIFKEAVHNASKYADADQVTITLARKADRFLLTVTDDGMGFDPGLHPDGHGLGSMQRRAKALGTELHLKSSARAGTRIDLEVDLARFRD